MADVKTRPPRESTLAVIEDVEFMLSTGAGWCEIITRLGRRETTVERLLERHERYDLAVRAKARDRERIAT